MSAIVHPGGVVGVLGGGQLGRMLALAGARLGLDVHVFTPEADSPAARVAAAVTVAAYEDMAALKRFARATDVVTFEFENVPVATLAACGQIAPIRPGLASLERTQDRLTEKQFIASLGLRTAPYAPVDSPASLADALAALGSPAILKTRRLGYDGKGQARISDPQDWLSAWDRLGRTACVLEGVVTFEREVSAIIARDVRGATAAFAVTENVHAGGILRRSTAPATIAPPLAAAAVDAAEALASALDHIGVLAVEFFVEPNGGLRVNEIAPRVHNSGHWTMDTPGACQFEQHMRAVAGWPLAAAAQSFGRAEMRNLIGEDATDWRALAGEPGARLHLYGKRELRQGRKLGHITRLTPPESGE